MGQVADEQQAAAGAIRTALHHYTVGIGAARTDDELLALRDSLLDWQLESRQLLTTIEERLGAFAGDDSPAALAAEAEALIEQIEGLQDAWESRVDLLLDSGYDPDQLIDYFTALLARPDRAQLLADLFLGLPADMDQAAEFLEYAKRYLLSLALPPPRR